MELTDKQVEKIVTTANSYLGHKYGPGLRCVDYVRKVYDEVGIRIPILNTSNPPAEFNIQAEMLQNPLAGTLIFLKNKKEKRQRAWSHVVIALSRDKCIHCSLFVGEVVTTSLEEIFERYEFAPSL